MGEPREDNPGQEALWREEMIRKIEADFGKIFDSSQDGDERIEMVLKKVEPILQETQIVFIALSSRGALPLNYAQGGATKQSLA